MTIILENTTVITPEETLENSAIVVGDAGRIDYVGPMTQAPSVEGLRFDLRDRIVIPGLIDIHVHGGYGITFGTAGTLEEDLMAYSTRIAENGVTGFLTTITASNPERLVQMIRSLVQLFEQGLPGAEALGIHLEGPFINQDKKGAQNPEWIHDPDVEEGKLYLEAGRGWIRQITMAPELPFADDVASLFHEADVVLAIGHSTADYETASKALRGKWSNITHTFNAQTGFHHRDPGIVGAVLNSEGITAELIADTIHVHPGAMRVLIRCLGTDRVVLITDAMAGAGLSDGQYELLGFKITVREGKATQDDGTIAGSTALLNGCVKNVHEKVGIPLADAVKMATLNPARVIGVSNRLGSLHAGMDASMAVIDENLDVYLTMVNGGIVFNRL
jgi:N-acetylglucosamine-6-phosphate deacetylase